MCVEVKRRMLRTRNLNCFPQNQKAKWLQDFHELILVELSFLYQEVGYLQYNNKHVLSEPLFRCDASTYQAQEVSMILIWILTVQGLTSLTSSDLKWLLTNNSYSRILTLNMIESIPYTMYRKYPHFLM